MKNLFLTLFKSFGDVQTYRIAAFEWKWKTLLYFVLLSLLTTLVTGAFALKQMKQFYADIAPKIEKSIVGVKIEDWKIVTPDGRDVELKTPDGKVVALVTQNYVDATKTSSLFCALEKDRLSFYMGETEIPILLKELMPNTPNFSASDLIPERPDFLEAIVFSLLFVVSLVVNATYLIILSLATFILSMTRAPNLGFIRCVKIASVALTPAIWLDIITLWIFGAPFPAFIAALLSTYIVFRVLPELDKNKTEQTL